MRIFVVTAALVLHLVLLPAPHCRAQAAKPPEKLAHFDGMPKLAALPDGTLAAYFIDVRGPGLAPTPAVQELKCRVSRDNGRTWGEPQSLLTMPAEEGGFGFQLPLVDQSGEVHLFIMGDANTGMLRAREPTATRPAVEPLPKQRIDIWHVRSTDGRTKWTKPKQIWKGRVSDLQGATQLKSGRIVLPFGDTVVGRSWRNRGEGFAAFTFFGDFDTHVLYSDDLGETWQKSESVLRVPTPSNHNAFGAVEPVVVQLKDGRVWMLIRTQLGRLFESFSDDGSVWSEPKPTAFVSSDAPAAFARLPDGRLVVMWNNCQRFPYARGGRQVLHAAISDDDGKTWRGRREILRDPLRNDPPPPTGDHGVSYVYPVVASNGHVVYSMWVETGQGRSVQSFDPNWLLETEAADDFSRGLNGWSVFGTRGVEVVSHEGSADGKVLSVRRSDPDWPCGAVWNFPSGAAGSLKLRVQIDPQLSGTALMLADHFSPPFDVQDEFHCLFRLPLTSETIQPGRWVDLELRWDTGKRSCDVLIDGTSIATLPQQHASAGPSYLRVRSDAVARGGGLLVDSVQVSVSPPR